MKSVLEAMDKNALRRALRKKRLVGVLKIPLLLLAGWLRVGSLVDQAWNAMSADARTRNQVNDVVTKAMKDWFAHVGEAGPDRLIVVFIDDLDRCAPRQVLRIFEGLKLYLDAPGFVFVIGYDEGVITEAVASEKRYTQRSTGRDYVEKIVQIVFRIPQPTDPEIDALLTHVLAESETSELFDDAGRKLVIDRNGRNPRRMKRFINRFILDYRLDPASQDLDPELLIKLLILETYFPDFVRLFTSATEKNPVQEFLEYAETRELLRRGTADSPVVDEVFRSYGMVRGHDNATSLQQLEQEVPEIFTALVRDDDFLSLANSLARPRIRHCCWQRFNDARSWGSAWFQRAAQPRSLGCRRRPDPSHGAASRHYRAPFNDPDESIQIVERRINELGTVEPLIQRQGADRILVPGAGIAGSNRAEAHPRQDRQDGIPDGQFLVLAGSGSGGAAAGRFGTPDERAIAQGSPMSSSSR